MYADYDFYRNEYHSTLSESEFEQWAARASLQIDRITTGRAASAPTCMERALALCCCTLAEQLQAWDAQDEQTQGGTVASENVDGYSVSYRSDGEATSRTAGRKHELHNICADYLTYPINLMYTGVW